MRQLRRCWRACLAGALLWGLCTSLALAASAAQCPPERVDQSAGVAHVLDGDTVLLRDQRKVRLIGINAPELARDQRPAEPLGSAARDALRRLIAASGGHVSLRYDSERHDRFGRTLAHVFTRAGDNLAAALLRDGLAAAIAVPPNLWQQPCYAGLAKAARERGDGIWSLARYRGTPLARLPRGASGFWTIEARVQSVRPSRSALWIDLGRGFALRLRRDDLIHFAGIEPEAWRHREVRVSGWISNRGGGRRMGLRHPSQLEIIR